MHCIAPVCCSIFLFSKGFFWFSHFYLFLSPPKANCVSAKLWYSRRANPTPPVWLSGTLFGDFSINLAFPLHILFFQAKNANLNAKSFHLGRTLSKEIGLKNVLRILWCKNIVGEEKEFVGSSALPFPICHASGNFCFWMCTPCLSKLHLDWHSSVRIENWWHQDVDKTIAAVECLLSNWFC